MTKTKLVPTKDNSKKYQFSKASPDHVATPRYVVEDMYKTIDIESYSNVWFPFNNYDSEFKLKAEELNLKYKATHIFDDLGNDFFSTQPPKGCDLLISNPPFSIQNEIIERTFNLADSGLIKSFALLLPLSTLETPDRANIYHEHRDRLSLIVLKKRVKFIGHTEVYPKGLCWVCYNINSLINQKISWM